MVKKCLTFILISVLMILSACGTNSSVKEQGQASNNLNSVGSNEIVNMHGNVKNLNRLDFFVENVTAKKSDEVKITHYTIEGDPIYDTVTFDGKQLKITNDNSEDKFGSGEIFTYTCKNLTKNESETGLEYLLIDCKAPDGSSGNHPIVSIRYNLAEQDYFAFRLEYGVNQKNVIDTKNQEIVKDLQNGEMATVMDFQFSESEMQQIYKVLVIGGYLGEKQISTQCKEKPLYSYKLKVWINQGEREFEWNRCDMSEDGKQMTKVADDIIAILKKNETYKGLPEVKGDYE
ncbi:DUF4362 domain-containing protein [Pseudoneobacillus rhizosphaerae]|uniref:DUF4362 domain-containing protein n=1 Tax=Pseudoneobacillus rhizosphaerae TaxID=2880968 RepID=A0A9C7G814_9BACI|nr:DUF4362 domain-containing protein [Pseudoneobacillus rhizosphaerae]CAG9607205.1 hypothetical protein NEOCIP111885_00895 [Pseudoneobacillus rhizosphaerae]